VKVFLDTNVLVSAFASRGICADLLELVLLEHELLIGQNVLRELRKALREKIKVPVARAAQIIEFVSDEAAQIINTAEPVQVRVDADDALVLGEALTGQAEMFVTGDAKLLELAIVAGLKIVSPRSFWEVLRARK
jgi:uncharacterized protein